MTQFVTCRLSSGQEFTYRWDGEPLAVGDTVKVSASGISAWNRFIVTRILDQMPTGRIPAILAKLKPGPDLSDVFQARCSEAMATVWREWCLHRNINHPDAETLVLDGMDQEDREFVAAFCLHAQVVALDERNWRNTHSA